jgi:hypothetical protein
VDGQLHPGAEWNAPAESAESWDVANELPVVLADRDYNYRLKMAYEGVLRDLEGRRRVKRGTVEGLIAGAG